MKYEPLSYIYSCYLFISSPSNPKSIPSASQAAAAAAAAAAVILDYTNNVIK